MRAGRRALTILSWPRRRSWLALVAAGVMFGGTVVGVPANPALAQQSELDESSRPSAERPEPRALALSQARLDTRPPAPAGVVSEDYPPGVVRGGVGVPGVFEILPPVERAHEVKEYAWTLDSGVVRAAETVPARPTDHGATLTIRPERAGINTLRVWSKNAAGFYSEESLTYTFTVRLPVGPAARWTFEEASGDAVDVTGHGNVASLGASATRVPGRSGVGSALALDGSTAATLSGPVMTVNPDTGADVPVRTDSTFTVTAWAKLASVGSAEQVVVAANGTRTFSYALSYAGGANRWRFAMADADGDDPTLYSVLSDAAPVAGKWTHLAGVYDAWTRTLTFYVNGVKQSGTATLTGGFHAASDVTIGKRRWNGGDDGFFTGEIDDVRVYNYVETPANIAEMAKPLQPVVTFPNGTQADVGEQLTVRFDARGDINVTKFRYSIDNTHLGSEVAADSPGGTATVTFNVGNTPGERTLYVVAVTDGNQVSDMMPGTVTVIGSPNISGFVIDVTTFEPVAGATVRMEPGGLTTTSDANGAYSFTGFEPGVYTISAEYGGPCGLFGSTTIEISRAGIIWDVYLLPYEGPGDTCSE